MQLVRLPNLFTAAADPLAGWIVAQGTLDDPHRWLPLVAASVLIYMGGIVLNDVFDVQVDRRERPNRPLPSGRVSFGLAAGFGALTLVAGPLVAIYSRSSSSAAVAAILALTVLAYDSGMKRTFLGPVVMGSCRSLNFLLGFTQIDALGGPYAWGMAICFGLFVAGVTWISRSEVETGRTRGITFGLGVELVGLIGLGCGAAFLGRLLDLSQRFPIAGVALFLILLRVIARVGLRAISEPIPATTQRAVKTGVLSLVWLDVAVVATTREPVYALAVAGLWVPAFFLGRWLYST